MPDASTTVPSMGLRPQDIADIVTVSDPRVSPDGSQVAYVVSRVDLAGNRYRFAIWLVGTDGSTPPRQLTAGEHGDSSPRWSPDGTRLAFTSSRPTTSPSDKASAARTSGPSNEQLHTLHVLPVAYPGETVTLAARQEGFDALAWSPRGDRLAFASRVRDPRYEAGDESAQPPRKLERLVPRIDGVGWTSDRPTHVFVVDADGANQPRQVTDGPFEHADPTWSPDGRTLAVVAARHEGADLEPFNDIYLVDVDVPGDGLRRLTTRRASSYRSLAWSPDGASIAALGVRGGVGYHHARLTLVDATNGEERLLADDVDLNFAPYPGAQPPVWLTDEDGQALLSSWEERGRVNVVRVPLRDGDAEVVVGGDVWVTAFSAVMSSAELVVAATVSDAATPTELVVLTTQRSQPLEERVRTSHQRSFLAAHPALEAERFEVVSEDGMALDAWIVRPEGHDGSAKVPVVLNVHGGPHTQYGEKWFDEFQLYASAGYAVVFGNPHGSTGYSEASARSILSPLSPEDPGTGWGGIDYRDILAILDAALQRYDWLDPDRVAVMGGSYGGFMTSWAIGHTDRFRTAISERAVNNLLSEEWTSDFGGHFRHDLGVSHLDHPEEYVRVSPVTYVRDISTPVCIIHSENDLRCPVEQADALWVALKLLGKPVEYYRFPGEGHELTRSGSPKHRVQRAEIVLDYLSRTL